MSQNPAPVTYEAALDELEQLIHKLEQGKLPLDEMLGAYQRGNELLQFCQGKLQAVQEQISLVQNPASN
jgi:exodeoxyribonuclease VII small subunit